jgi:hypothetical protein
VSRQEKQQDMLAQNLFENDVLEVQSVIKTKTDAWTMEVKIPRRIYERKYIKRKVIPPNPKQTVR